MRMTASAQLRAIAITATMIVIGRRSAKLIRPIGGISVEASGRRRGLPSEAAQAITNVGQRSSDYNCPFDLAGAQPKQYKSAIWLSVLPTAADALSVSGLCVTPKIALKDARPS
jgi:hypothetical protein